MFTSLALISNQSSNAGFTAGPLAEMSGSAMSVAWGVMLFCIILGLLVTLSPSRRTTEIKRAKDE